MIVWNNNTDRKVSIYSRVHGIKTYQTSQWTKVWITGTSVNMDRATTTRKVEMKVRKFDETMNSIDRSVVFLTFSRGICDMQFFTRDSRDLYDTLASAYVRNHFAIFYRGTKKKYTVEEWMYAISMYKCVIEICVVDVTTNCLRKKVDAHLNKTKWKKNKKKKHILS